MNNIMQPFLKSNCYVTDDFGLLNDAKQRGFNIVCLVEPEETSLYPDCSIASLLLPHPVIILEFLNSDPKQVDYNTIIQKYLYDYQNYLASAELEGSIVNILASLYKLQRNLLLFCPTDQNREFKILDSIAYFLSNAFGIIPGNYQYLFNPDPRLAPRFIDSPAFRYVFLDLLFINGFIDMREYSVKLPPNSIPSPRATAKIFQIINKPLPDLKSGITIAISVIESIKQEYQTGKISPFIETRQNISNEMENKINQMLTDQKPNQQHVIPPMPPQNNYLQNIKPNIIQHENQIPMNNEYAPRQPLNNNQPYTPPPPYNQNMQYQQQYMGQNQIPNQQPRIVVNSPNLNNLPF